MTQVIRRSRRFSSRCRTLSKEPETELSAPCPDAASANANENGGESVPPLRKPTWQQATALVSLSTCGAMTGFAFAHGTVDEMTSRTRIPVKLMALDTPAKPVKAEQTGDSALRSAIVKVAK